MQEDTYRGEQTDPLSLNLYTYCHNNPIKYWDPTGHMAITVTSNGSGGWTATDGDGNNYDVTRHTGAGGGYVIGGGIYFNPNTGVLIYPGGIKAGGIQSGGIFHFNLPGNDFTYFGNGGNLNVFGNIGTLTIDGKIGILTTGKKSSTTINNNGIIESIITGDGSKNLIHNNGTIDEVTLGIGNSTNISGNAAGAVWFDLMSNVLSLPSSSYFWDWRTNEYYINIGGVPISFQVGETGVRVNANNRAEVRADAFANKFMPEHGERIFLGSHSVYTANHAGIIMMIDSRSSHWNNNYFTEGGHSLFGGAIRFATIGAGPCGGPANSNTLVAGFNRKGGSAPQDIGGDVGIVTGNGNKLQMRHIPSSAGSISLLISRAEYFIENHNGQFQYFGRPRAASNHFNSNSFTHGLLISVTNLGPPYQSSAGVTIPNLSSSAFGGFPGWNGGQNLHDRGVFGNVRR
jgi:hypothetical protein